MTPGKRPLNTIIAGLASRDGHAVLAFGVVGGDYQPAGHLHVLTNWLGYDWDIQAALDAPRVFHRAGVVEYELGIPPSSLAGLEQRGHGLQLASQPIGGAQAVMIDWRRGRVGGGERQSRGWMHPRLLTALPAPCDDSSEPR